MHALELGRQADGGVTVLSALDIRIRRSPANTLNSTAGVASVFLDQERKRLHAQLSQKTTNWYRIEEVVEIGRAYKVILAKSISSSRSTSLSWAHREAGAWS